MVEESLDVVVVQYGATERLFRLLESIGRASVKPAGVKVIVNGKLSAADWSRLSCMPNVEVTENGCNTGFSAAANQGLRLSRRDYVALLNNDLIVSGNWIPELLDGVRGDEGIALAQPKILSVNRRELFDYAGGSGGFIDWFGFPVCRGRVFGTLERDTGQYDDSRDVFWASGAALLLNRKAALSAGGFDPFFFIYHEETDLAWRVQRLGYRVVVQPKSVVYHEGAASFKEAHDGLRMRYYYMHRNGWLMLIKNHSTHKLRYVLPTRFLIEVIGICMNLLLNPDESIAAVQGLLWALGHLRAVREMRPSIPAGRVESARRQGRVVVPGLLLLRYYILGQRRFAQIEASTPLERVQ